MECDVVEQYGHTLIPFHYSLSWGGLTAILSNGHSTFWANPVPFPAY